MEDFRIEKALYLTFQLVVECDGVSKKIFAQRNALVNLGIDVDIIYPTQLLNRTLFFQIDHTPFFTIHLKIVGSDFGLFYKKIYNHIKSNQIELLYIRYGLNASPLFNNFLRKCKEIGCKIVLEIPTYPYDGECKTLKDKLCALKEQYYRNKLDTCIDKVVTYSAHEYIFGIPTVNISNSVAYIPPLNSVLKIEDRVNFIGVANLAFWHGFDRLINGLHTYYLGKPELKVYFTIVGKGDDCTLYDLKKLVYSYELQEYVIFEGPKDGKELDELFLKSHLAIGCLACHRKNINEVKSLKNIEYAMRGIPFIYSENNNDFDEKDYILKIPANETEVDIKSLCCFVQEGKFVPDIIRESVKNMTWENQMRKILSSL